MGGGSSPSPWVNTSTAEHSHVDNVSYGYFWWRHMFNVEMPGGTEQVVVTAAQGNGGQKIYIGSISFGRGFHRRRL